MTQRTRSTIAVTLSCLLAATSVTFGADKSSKSNKHETAAEEQAAKYPIPQGFRGFDGTLGGTVVSVQSEMRGFVLKVDQVLHINARSTASDPNSVIGHEIEITPRVTKDAKGKWVPNQQTLDFIKSLKKGQNTQVDVANTDAHHTRIADMTKGQKEQAAHEKSKENKQK